MLLVGTCRKPIELGRLMMSVLRKHVRGGTRPDLLVHYEAVFQCPEPLIYQCEAIKAQRKASLHDGSRRPLP